MITLILNSILLGIGLAMDAFSVSLANGLNEPSMKKNKMIGIAGTFALFQFLMPLIGWILVLTVAKIFTSFQIFIPYIALLLLGYIGINMIVEGIKNKDIDKPGVGIKALIIQGIATSIDALSVGFTISEYNFREAFSSSLIIGVVTFIICIFGLMIGKKFGTKLAGKASIFGGIILIAIGFEIFVKGVFF